MDDTSTDFREQLLLWSDELPEECHKKNDLPQKGGFIFKVVPAMHRLLLNLEDSKETIPEATMKNSIPFTGDPILLRKS